MGSENESVFLREDFRKIFFNISFVRFRNFDETVKDGGGLCAVWRVAEQPVSWYDGHTVSLW